MNLGKMHLLFNIPPVTPQNSRPSGVQNMLILPSDSKSLNSFQYQF